jgi:hypothetical protein
VRTVATPILRTDDTVCANNMRKIQHTDHTDRSTETSTPDPSATDRRVRRRLLRSGGYSSDISRSATAVAAVGHVGVNAHVAPRGEGCINGPGPFQPSAVAREVRQRMDGDPRSIEI